ncbi:MAG: biotin--[acetyl-CoA-carboxylase] ligase, partial [Pseudomonadota bacterium]
MPDSCSRIAELPEVTSTNDVARAWAAEGVINGAVRADRQTKGRGRAGRSWISEGGNFYASWLTKPNLEM